MVKVIVPAEERGPGLRAVGLHTQTGGATACRRGLRAVPPSLQASEDLIHRSSAKVEGPLSQDAGATARRRGVSSDKGLPGDTSPPGRRSSLLPWMDLASLPGAMRSSADAGLRKRGESSRYRKPMNGIRIAPGGEQARTPAGLPCTLSQAFWVSPTASNKAAKELNIPQKR